VTRGQLPQRAGSLGLNGGRTATAVPPNFSESRQHFWLVREQFSIAHQHK